MKTQHIFIAGASGYVGGYLVPKLVQGGYHVRCLTRNPEKLLARKWNNIDVVKGDVLEPDTLVPALAGIDTAYYLVHAMGSKGDFEDRDI